MCSQESSRPRRSICNSNAFNPCSSLRSAGVKTIFQSLTVNLIQLLTMDFLLLRRRHMHVERLLRGLTLTDYSYSFQTFPRHKHALRSCFQVCNTLTTSKSILQPVPLRVQGLLAHPEDLKSLSFMSLSWTSSASHTPIETTDRAA